MKNEKQEFKPPFCPNPGCRFHHTHANTGQWFICYSSYLLKRESRRCQRYMCLGCNKTFSERTFASDYCLKLDLDYEKLFAPLIKFGGLVSVEQWAGMLGHSVSVIENRLSRLGRWLVLQGYLSAHQVSRLKGWGWVQFGLFLLRLWVSARCPEHGVMKRYFLKQLEQINNVVAVEVWRLLSWCYRLTVRYFYRPAFTYH